MILVAVVQISSTAQWYGIPSSERAQLRTEIAHQVFTHKEVTCRWFDSDPWTGDVSELVVCEFSNLVAYWDLWNQLLEHRLFTESYLRIAQVSLGYERPISVGLVDT